MKIFAGPFIGEFGWELMFWHGWLRKLKEEVYPNSHFIVSSFPGREPLYEFADEYISLPDFYLKNDFSERDYFVDWEIFDIDKQKYIFGEMEKLISFYKEMFKSENIDYIFNFPQKKFTRNLIYRIKNKLNLNFLNNVLIKNKSFKEVINNFNKYPGIKIPTPLILNPVNREIKDLYNPQKPKLIDQKWVKLKPTSEGIKLRDKLVESYDLTNRPVFSIFPRKRTVRREDKNWTELKWRKFINLLIKKYDPIIILSGTPQGAFFSEEKNSSNIINIINEDKKNILNLQLAFLEISQIAIHGRSGSCNLSLQHGCPTFMAGPEKDRDVICNIENPRMSEILYYTEFGVNPEPEKLFEVFNIYYANNLSRLS